MMNLVALFLVITSLATAGVFTPLSATQKQDDVIVKDGHRVVTVEYDEHGEHNTKVSFSSPESRQQSMEEKISSAASDVLDNTKGKIKQAASVFPDMKTEEFDPGQIVCDAYDVCRDKLTGAIVKANEAKESVVHRAHDLKEGAKETMKKTKDTAVNRAEDVKQGMRETAEEKTGTLKQRAVGAVSKAAKETKEIGKTIRGDVIRNVTEEAANLRDDAKTGVKRGFGLIWDLGSSDKVIGFMSVLNLLGFSVSYGMSVWVTFVSSYVLSRALPRNQLGVVHSKIYPVYFRVLASSIGLAFLGHTLPLVKSRYGLLQGGNLLGSLFMVLVNCFYLEPRATKVKKITNSVSKLCYALFFY